MKLAGLGILTLLVAGCSCAIHTMPYAPSAMHPSADQFAEIAQEAGYEYYSGDSKRQSYSAEGLGMHYIPKTGALDFTNSHCPILPFWTQPGYSFERQSLSMKPMLDALDSSGFPYRLKTNQEAQQGGDGDA